MPKIKPIAITTGDHRGIGPEVISKGLSILFKNKKNFPFVIFGKPELYFEFKKHLPNCQRVVFSSSDIFKKSFSGFNPNYLNFVLPSIKNISAHLEDATLSAKYISDATTGTLNGLFSAVVTGPIDKYELHRAGYFYDGHTEFLQKICKAKSVTMMLANKELRISLVTTHISINKISASLTKNKIIQTVKNTADGLNNLFGIKNPRIAVLALNPHAGDKGLFGIEEKTVIQPAINYFKNSNITVSGPYAADGFFALWKTVHKNFFDAVVCMYHDQGLVPVKLLDFKNSVNITLGLPMIRTSVDHGTGLDIVGKNKADPSSFCSAFLLAQQAVISKK